MERIELPKKSTGTGKKEIVRNEDNFLPPLYVIVKNGNDYFTDANGIVFTTENYRVARVQLDHIVTTVSIKYRLAAVLSDGTLGEV